MSDSVEQSSAGGGARLPSMPPRCVMVGACGRQGTCCQSDSALYSRHFMSNARDALCMSADLPVGPAYMHSSPQCGNMRSHAAPGFFFLQNQPFKMFVMMLITGHHHVSRETSLWLHSDAGRVGHQLMCPSDAS